MTELARVRTALSDVGASDALYAIAVPAELGAIERRVGSEGVFWSRGFELAGSGVAASVSADGPERFGVVRERGRELLSRIRTIGFPDGAPRPRLFGGFSFHARPPSAEWSSFGQALFVLPRLSFVREANQSFVCLIVSGRELADRALDELEAALEPAAIVTPLERRPPKLPSHDAGFVELVGAITRGIEDRLFSKVVAARSRAIPLPAAIDLARLLRALPDESTRFALARGDRAFVGGSPERLIAVSGRDVSTEALAGSVRANDRSALERLLASEKERAEHRIVRDAIVTGLADFGTVTAAERPEPRVLRHVTHLATPIRAQLSRPRHVLELVERLHPTPAVGGEPRDAALAFLARSETFDRGWYAAPFGWFDRNGDGEFCVALRSALLERETARLYAGAGIVCGSEPEAELAETELKLAGLSELLEAPA